MRCDEISSSWKIATITDHKYWSEAYLIIVLSVDFSGLSLPFRWNFLTTEKKGIVSNCWKWEMKTTTKKLRTRKIIEKELQTHWFNRHRISRLNNYYFSGTTFTILNKSAFGHSDTNNKCWNMFFYFISAFCKYCKHLQRSAEKNQPILSPLNVNRIAIRCKLYTVNEHSVRVFCSCIPTSRYNISPFDVIFYLQLQ